MKTNPVVEIGQLTSRVKSIIDYVRDCERRVNMGEIMDLQGLDQNVLEICDHIAALPPEQSKTLEDQMSTLIEDLEKLAESMQEQQAKIDKGEK